MGLKTPTLSQKWLLGKCHCRCHLKKKKIDKKEVLAFIQKPRMLLPPLLAICSSTW